MTITAKIIADSVSPEGARITTMQLRYQRFIHAECKTHRVLDIDGTRIEVEQDVGVMDDPNLSRNASSSRATPVERLIQDVIDDPAMPIHWGKNQKGMQADKEHDELVVFRNDAVSPEQAWLRSRDLAVEAARRFAKAGYHKQVVNRILEPYAHINVVVTATDWDNFFELRDHPDAQPEIQALAQAMKAAMAASRPAHVGLHLPYVSDGDFAALVRLYGATGAGQVGSQVSAARCARVSYLTHNGKTPEIDADLALYQRLAGGVPFHASPLEHQARPAHGRHANLTGWQSFRTEQGL